jgi:membrane-bound lytic murein transglycosylase MltF
MKTLGAVGLSLLLQACAQGQPPASQQATPEPQDGTPEQQKAAPAPQEPGTTLSIEAQKFTGDYAAMIKRRTIRAGVAYNRTHYFIDKGVQRGAAYESLKLFEDKVNAKISKPSDKVHVVFVPLSRDAMLAALQEGRVDLLAAQITLTPEAEKVVDFSDPTMKNVNEIVVTGPGAPKLASKQDLSGQQVFVRKPSAPYFSLVSLNESLKAQGKAEVILKEAPGTLEDEDLLEMVNAGLVKIVVVDNHLARLWKTVLPNLTLHEDVTLRVGADKAVAMRKNSPQLRAAVNAWIAKYGPRTAFGNTMLQRYTVSTKFVKNATSEAEIKRFQELVKLFKQYGDKYKVDYVLMAAQGYQESGLNQSAKSRVGAIGVMQVMPATGKELAVGDIRKVDSNINAGVKYMRFMIDQYFKDEPMDDLNKALFAFASYNAGPNRIRQLRLETKKRGLNPNLWFNNVEQIVSEKIGRETVTYVANIYKYYIAYTLAMELRDARAKGHGQPPS